MQFCIVRPDTLGEIQDLHVRFGFFDLTDQTRAVMLWKTKRPDDGGFHPVTRVDGSL